MRYTHTHIIETGIDRFWEVFFDPSFNQALHLHQLEYTSFRIVKDTTQPDGVRQRHFECVPKLAVPSAARAFFGDSARYTEVGLFDPGSQRYLMEVVPAFGGDKLKMVSELWVEPAGPHHVKRYVRGEVNVKVFGVARVLEAVARQQTRDAYERSAEFTSHWVQQRSSVAASNTASAWR
jgi:hypothetical protein